MKDHLDAQTLLIPKLSSSSECSTATRSTYMTSSSTTCSFFRCQNDFFQLFCWLKTFKCHYGQMISTRMRRHHHHPYHMIHLSLQLSIYQGGKVHFKVIFLNIFLAPWVSRVWPSNTSYKFMAKHYRTGLTYYVINLVVLNINSLEYVK